VQRLARNGRRYYTKTQQHTGIHTHDTVCLGRRVLAGTIDVRFCSLSTLSLFVEWLLAVGVRVMFVAKNWQNQKSSCSLAVAQRSSTRKVPNDRWGLLAESPRLCR